MEKTPPPPYSQAMSNPQPGFIQPSVYPPLNPQPEMYHKPEAVPTVVMAAPPVIHVLGPESQTVTCPHCHHQVTTRVESEAATKTHLFALLLCVFGCVPCCLIPYCTDSCQNRNHYCPSCGAFLGAYTN